MNELKVKSEECKVKNLSYLTLRESLITFAKSDIRQIYLKNQFNKLSNNIISVIFCGFCVRYMHGAGMKALDVIATSPYLNKCVCTFLKFFY